MPSSDYQHYACHDQMNRPTETYQHCR